MPARFHNLRHPPINPIDKKDNWRYAEVEISLRFLMHRTSF